MANRYALADQAQRIANTLRSSVTDESELQIALEETQQLAAGIKDAVDDAISEQVEVEV